MKCGNCGGNLKLIKEKYIWDDKFLGNIFLDDFEYEKCDKCGETLFSPESCEKIKLKKAEVLDKWLSSQSIGSFCKIEDACKALGVSRQAIHQSMKYRGLIYFKTFGGDYFFLKKSLEQFIKTGDGRLTIANSDPVILPEFMSLPDRMLTKTRLNIAVPEEYTSSQRESGEEFKTAA